MFVLSLNQLNFIKFSLLNIMEKSKFSEHQIVNFLKESESGMATKALWPDL